MALEDQRVRPRRHAPARRGCGLEHAARGGTAAAHRHEEVARRARAVGVLVAVARLVARRLHDAHARPVALELLGDELREALAARCDRVLRLTRGVLATALRDKHREFHEVAGGVARQINAARYDEAERMIGAGSRFAAIAPSCSATRRRRPSWKR